MTPTALAATTLPSETNGAGEIAPPGTSSLAAYFELAKGRLVVAIVVVVAATFLAAGGDLGWRLVAVLAGTAATAGAAGALNQWWEAPWDALMERTRNRPIPTGRIGSRDAVAFATGLFALGAVVLQVGAGTPPALLATASAALYVLAYTPLKRRTPLSLVPGALSGALPALIGWTAVTGAPSAHLVLLFVVLLAWQVPHTLAIDWRYRDDYARGGYRTLSRLDPTGRATGNVAVAGAVLTGAVSVGGLVWLASPGWAIAAAALAATGLIVAACGLGARPDDAAARRLFRATVLILPLLLAAHLLPGAAP